MGANGFWENGFQDIRYGIRVLIKNPGYALIAILTLALGIGVNAAIFSVVYGVLLRPLPYGNGDRLIVLHQEATKAHVANVRFSAKEIFDYRDQSHTLDAVVEHHSMNFLLLGRDSAERVNTAVVSANFFDVLGVRPLLGRTFVASDDTPQSDAVLILSNGYWKGRHGGDPNIVGKVFQMNNRPHTVIGVLPPIPQYPIENDVYMPTSQCPTRSSPGFIANRRARMMTAFGRLKPGASLEQAQSDLATLASQIEKANPDAYPSNYGYGIKAASLQDDLTRRARTTFLVLLGASGLVLLIACANVANLLLARLLKLGRELAIRTALGATKIRLVRQLLTESILLALAGGLLGLAIAPATMSLLVKFAERFTTRATEIKIDGPVLGFTLLVSILTGIVFGLAPAFSSSKSAADSLRQGGRATSGRGANQLRSVLVVSQIAISFALVIGAGLMVRSFVRLQQVDAGFSADKLLTMRLSPNFTHFTQAAQLAGLVENVMHKVSAVSGVESTALASTFPFSPNAVTNGPGSTAFQIEGRPVSKGELAPIVDTTVVSSAYFDTIRQPLQSGRFFTDHDDAASLQVAVINQTMARHRWPGENPIGKRISVGQNSTAWITIVGVVGDAKEYGLDKTIKDEVYLPLKQNGFASYLVVRTAADPMAVSSAVRLALHDADPQLAVDQVNTLKRLRQDSVATPKVTTILLGLFGGLALIISACGIAAVMALSVTQRTSELGIRMALGASRESVLMMITRQGLVLALIGTVAGVVTSIALTRLLSTLLYETSPTDVLTFVAVSVIFLLVAGVASYIPARQVTGIDPAIALRQE